MSKKCPTVVKESYIYEGQRITVDSHYIYEINVYRIAKNRANIILSRSYKSNKLLDVKEVEILREYDSFTIERFITLVSAPLSFIEENNLSLYIKPKRKKHGKRNERKEN